MRQWSSDSETAADGNCEEENPLHPSSPDEDQFDCSNTASVLTMGNPTTSNARFSRPSLSVVKDEERQTKAIAMEFGDEYFGEVITERGSVIPQGRGTLQSSLGKHCYVGDFVKRWRDGYGKLVTERYVLWSKWRMNRPDLTNSARVDYANGDKYCGFLTLQQDNTAAQHLSRGLRSRLSKFSVWALTTSPVRERWGELVGANGDRYFGQWEDDLPSGFGCLATAGGERYVGLFKSGKFHDTGTLFALAYARGGGGGPPLLDGARFLMSPSPSRDALRGSGGSLPPLPKRADGAVVWPGVVFDGVWKGGRFAGEGYVTLPCGSRVSADWRSASQPAGGRVVLAPRASSGAARECFHWEALLCGAYEDAKSQEYALCEAYRDRLRAAMTAAEVHAVLTDFCAAQGAVRNAIKVFCRCFYFLHGTCGRGGEIGAGLGGNRLGWCYLRNALGGCIHRGRGRPITAADVDLARTDIVSFVRSVQRWAVAMMGDAALADSSAEVFLARRVLDAVLREVHGVLFNLYIHAFAAEDRAVAAAVARMREAATLDDLGVDFARRQSEERLFDPYADAIHGIEQLGQRVHTFSGKLRVLAQWSKEIDLSTRLAQVRMDDKSASLLPRRGPALALGSADDLLPIHQYVLMKARLPHLYAHTKLLVDLSGEDAFMEFTSRENFLVTTLQACVAMLDQLHPRLRDGPDGVLAPPALFDERIRAAISGLRGAAVDFCAAFGAPQRGAARGWGMDAAALREAAGGYLRAWLPDALSAIASGAGRAASPWSDATEDSAEEEEVSNRTEHFLVSSLLPNGPKRAVSALDERREGNGVVLFCWLAAARLTAALHMGVALLENGRTLPVSTLPHEWIERFDQWTSATQTASTRLADTDHGGHTSCATGNSNIHPRGRGNRHSDEGWMPTRGDPRDGIVALVLHKPFLPSILHRAAAALLVEL